MISSLSLLKVLKKNKINFYSGVPDSVLKSFIKLIENNKKKHFVCPNEGLAVSLNIGNYLSTKEIGLTYLQNSGLGNAINPLISICHKQVYSIPMVLLIGWRGAPGLKDEPQHLTKGKVTKKILNLLSIKSIELKKKSDLTKVNKLIQFAKIQKEPVAILIKNNILKEEIRNDKAISSHKKPFFFQKGIKRSEVIEYLLEKIKKKTKIISTTGFTSRELHQIRSKNNVKYGDDFYMVGGMGHASTVASGVVMNLKSHQVICIDGDGSAIMHLGALLLSSKINNRNFKHIILNNYVHESVGGFSSGIENIKISKIAKACGYKNVFFVKDRKFLKKN